MFSPTLAPPTWGSNLVREAAQGPDSGRFPHKLKLLVAGGLVAQWPNGPRPVAGGGPCLVAWWPGGPVAR